LTNLRTTCENPSSAPAPAGDYSHVARLQLGDGVLIMVSGQLALGENGELIGKGSMAQQSERVFAILDAPRRRTSLSPRPSAAPSASTSAQADCPRLSIRWS
jgi:hypothetical protein